MGIEFGSQWQWERIYYWYPRFPLEWPEAHKVGLTCPRAQHWGGSAVDLPSWKERMVTAHSQLSWVGDRGGGWNCSICRMRLEERLWGWGGDQHGFSLRLLYSFLRKGNSRLMKFKTKNKNKDVLELTKCIRKQTCLLKWHIWRAQDSWSGNSKRKKKSKR